MTKSTIKTWAAVTIAAFLLVGANCAAKQPRVQLQPGEQVSEAEVDIKTASVTSQREGVTVRVQSAIIPAPGSDEPRPAFWVTVSNGRSSKIVIKPASTRLIDTFGNQQKPLPMMVNEGRGDPYRYVNVDPRVHFYFSANYGWPYYPFYPYHGWFSHRPYHRAWYRGWYPGYDPFWDWGFGTYYDPYWVRQVAPVYGGTREQLAKEETLYQGAKMTYAVLFPKLGELVREVRLIVPEITLYEDGQELKSLDFELIFNQIIEVKED